MATAGDSVRSLGSAAYEQTGGLSQTSIIFACLVTGFFVYITCKGQLPNYIALFVGKQPSSGS